MENLYKIHRETFSFERFSQLTGIPKEILWNLTFYYDFQLWDVNTYHNFFSLNQGVNKLESKYCPLCLKDNY